MTVDHRPGCPERRPVGTFVGRDGDTLARCPDCGALRVLEHADAPTAPPEPAPLPEPEPEPRATASRYVCPEHPDRGVTWRGKGCPECTQRPGRPGKHRRPLAGDADYDQLARELVRHGRASRVTLGPLSRKAAGWMRAEA